MDEPHLYDKRGVSFNLGYISLDKVTVAYFGRTDDKEMDKKAIKKV